MSYRKYLPFAYLCSLVGVAAIGACSISANQKLLAQGQLFCAEALATGPMVVALTDALGAPIIVTGLLASTVADACKAINAIPVSPPPSPATAPTVAAPIAISGGVVVPVVKG